MTEEQIKILNDAISNIKLLCKSYKTCIECPMNHNCNEEPANWDPIKDPETEYRQKWGSLA